MSRVGRSAAWALLVAVPALVSARGPVPNRGTIQFKGAFRIGGYPAPSGTRISLLTLRTADEVFQCGVTTVTGRGSFSLEVEATPRCSDEGNGGGPVFFVFTYAGESVGYTNFHVRPARPGSKRTFPIELAAPANPARPPTGPPLVLQRFYGRLKVSGRPAPAGLELSIQAAANPRGSNWFECGKGRTQPDGWFSIDIPAEAPYLTRCSDAVNGKGPVFFRFYSKHDLVGETSFHLKPTASQHVGQARQVMLRAGRLGS